MRNLIFGVMLGVVATAGLYTAISASIAQTRPATFAERFAPALKAGG